MGYRWSIARGLLCCMLSSICVAAAPHRITTAVVSPAQVELAKPIERSHDFAFSPDATAVAFARSKMLNIRQIGDVVHDGPIPIDELVQLKLSADASEQTLVAADFTKQFAVYGTQLFDIRWQADRIRFVVSNGDDSAAEFDYLLTEHRLADTQSNDVFEQPDPEQEALLQSLLGCFSEMPDTLIHGGFKQALLGSDYAIFQVQASDYPNDIWLVNRATCSRNRVNVDALAANKDSSLTRAVLSQGTLTLVMRQSLSQFRKTRIWQTPLRQALTRGTPPEWREWTGVPLGYFDAFLIGTAASHPLLLLQSSYGDCDDVLLNIGTSGIEQLQVEGHALCDATAHPDGKLALSLYRYTSASELQEKMPELRANQLLVIGPAFAKSLRN